MFSHDKRNCWWVMLMITLSIFFFAGMAFAAVGDITISVPSGASQGSSFTSEIKVDVGDEVLGAYNVTFIFNRSVLQITTVEGGTTLEFSGAPTYNDIALANSSGQINVVAFQASDISPKNLVSIFRITFSVVGDPGNSSNLSMTVNDLANSNFEQISNQVVDASLTVDATPTVTTNVVSSITDTTASSGGVVVSDSGSAVTERGICWRTSTGPTVADSHSSNGTGTGSFNSSMTGLTRGTTYYMRAYGTSSVGTGYGEERVFVTLDYATVFTTPASGITPTSANGGGNITKNGGANITARGVCWRTSANPTIDDGHTSDGAGTGVFTSLLTGLTRGTTYYMRAYGVNSVGVTYGDNTVFATPATKPTVVTTPPSNITSSSAASGGNITDDGGANVTAKGLCWSTSPNPTTADSKTSDGTGIDAYFSSITGLDPATGYHIRAYAANSVGLSYGAEYAFTTDAVEPTVETSEVSTIGLHSAWGGGAVIADGGAALTARGVCWSTSPNPTIADARTINGTGIGSFTGYIGDLNPGTDYYVRAYAVNNVGVGYGHERTFTTEELTAITLSFSRVKENGNLKSEIVSFDVTRGGDDNYTGSFLDSEGISYVQKGKFYGNDFFWTTTASVGPKANGKINQIWGRQDLAGSIEPVEMGMNLAVMPDMDLSGYWSISLSYSEWGWKESRGPGSKVIGFFAKATSTPGLYDGTFTSSAGNPFSVTLEADGNRIIWNMVSPGIYQAKGTGFFMPAGVLGTYTGKSLDPSDPDGRHLGTCSARFTPLPVDRVVLGYPPIFVFSGDRFTVPLMMDVGSQVLGSYSLKILFDPDVVNIYEVTGGATAEFSGPPSFSMNNEDGFVTVAAFQAGETSPTGVVHVANLTFDVVGMPTDYTAFTIDTTWANYDIADPDFNLINLTQRIIGNAVVAPVRVDAGTVAPMDVMAEKTLDVPFNIGWALNQVIGAYNFELLFDPLVFEAMTVTGGTTAEFTGVPTFNIDNINGSVTFNAFNASTTSPVGFADVARVTLKAKKVEVDTVSVVKLKVYDLQNQDSDVMMPYVEDSIVVVTTGLCGDVNENERVDIGDAMFIAQYNVGNRSDSELNLDVADVNVNGRVDIGDAMFIAQFNVGNRACICEGEAMEYCGEE